MAIERPEEQKSVERELSRFRIWFSVLTFLLTAVAFVIGFPALEDAGRKIGLGELAFGLPFAIDLGMVTLLLWSMWNRGLLKRWWPPLVPAGLLLALSSWLQYIHAVDLISEETPELARFGLLVLAASLPLLLALSAGVFESVTFAPLIDRAKRHTELMREQQRADDELWRIEMEQKRAKSELSASIMRNRMEIESRTQLQLMEAEAEAAAKALKSHRPAARKPEPLRTVSPKNPTPKSPSESEEFEKERESRAVSSPNPGTTYEESAMVEALTAVRSGSLSQRAAAEQYRIPRSALRKRLEEN